MISSCPICGDEFEANTVGRKRKYCSKECQSKRDKFRTKRKYVCLNCSKEFFRRPRSDKKNKFCCYQCSVEYRTYGVDDMAEHICKICDKSFYTLPGDSNPNLYCSKRCQLISVSSKHRPYTEEVFEKFLLSENIDYTIQFQYDKYFADFYIPKSNLLIELDGRTFHSSTEAVRKDKIKSNMAVLLGYNMVRIWCSREKQVNKLLSFSKKLTGDDLAEIISAIPKRMINSVNLVEQGCSV